MENLNYDSGRSARADPCREKLLEKYEYGIDVMNQVTILCQVQVAGKKGFEDLRSCANKLNCQCFHSFLQQNVMRHGE